MLSVVSEDWLALDLFHKNDSLGAGTPPPPDPKPMKSRCGIAKTPAPSLGPAAISVET